MTGGLKKCGNTWYYFFDADKTLLIKGGKTKTEAKKALSAAIVKYERNIQLTVDPNFSLTHYLDFWQKNYVELNCKYSTISGYKIMIERHIKPALGYYKLSSISPTEIQEFINQKYISGLGRRYIANILSVLNSSLKMAVHPYNLIFSNPAAYVKLPKNKNSRLHTKKKSTNSERNKKNYRKISFWFIFLYSYSNCLSHRPKDRRMLCTYLEGY